jgi:lactoylglutathione lyase
MIVVEGVAHIGIRVAEAERAKSFFGLLGFEETWRGGSEPVVILKNAAGVEINLIVNAAPRAEPSNILMDVPEKLTGYTHVALSIASVEDTVAELVRLGIPISGGPVTLGDGVSLFIRDPDRNVIELRRDGLR